MLNITIIREKISLMPNWKKKSICRDQQDGWNHTVPAYTDVQWSLQAHVTRSCGCLEKTLVIAESFADHDEMFEDIVDQAG
jgi:hypothetical protein